MSWTDERVETLKKLHKDGLSCSQIASALGGVSRNGVIGKLNRMGMRRETLAGPSVTKALGNRNRTTGSPFGFKPSTPAPAKLRPLTAPTPSRAPLPREPAETPLCGDLCALTASMCRWPIGDPSAPGFCGRRKGEGSYCVAHAARAVQPQTERKQSSAGDLARSLRRYI